MVRVPLEGVHSLVTILDLAWPVTFRSVHKTFAVSTTLQVVRFGSWYLAIYRIWKRHFPVTGIEVWGDLKVVLE